MPWLPRAGARLPAGHHDHVRAFLYQGRGACQAQPRTGAANQGSPSFDTHIHMETFRLWTPPIPDGRAAHGQSAQAMGVSFNPQYRLF